MLRTITLSLLMLISVGIMLPFASSTAHGLRQSSAATHHRRHRRHSRAWWRRHRARMRLRRAAARAHRNAPLVPVFANPGNRDLSTTVLSKVPAGWSNSTVGNNGEVRLRTDTSASVPGQATLSVVARSRPNPAYLTQREQRRMLAGTAFSDLRRIVIDKMINAGGWVINDYERQFDGARVFVVIAQTPSDSRSPEKSWNFYFAEVDGKIYSLTLNTPLQFSSRLAGEGEKFIASLRAKASANGQSASR
ncbi:MAG: hypothetical protein ABR556_09095 [Pyrinomonadaceae bacterium]